MIPTTPRLLKDVLVTAFGLVLLTALAGVLWVEARRRFEAKPRLRLEVVAARNLLAGEQLTRDALRVVVRHESDSGAGLSNARPLLGLYLIRNVPLDSCIQAGMVGGPTSVTVPAGSHRVAVHVPKDCLAALQPGDIIQFVPSAPAPKKEATPLPERGVTLLAIVREEESSKRGVALVAVPDSLRRFGLKLATGEWTPILAP